MEHYQITVALGGKFLFRTDYIDDLKTAGRVAADLRVLYGEDTVTLVAWEKPLGRLLNEDGL